MTAKGRLARQGVTNSPQRTTLHSQRIHHSHSVPVMRPATVGRRPAQRTPAIQRRQGTQCTVDLGHSTRLTRPGARGLRRWPATEAGQGGRRGATTMHPWWHAPSSWSIGTPPTMRMCVMSSSPHCTPWPHVDSAPPCLCCSYSVDYSTVQYDPQPMFLQWRMTAHSRGLYLRPGFPKLCLHFSSDGGRVKTGEIWYRLTMMGVSPRRLQHFLKGWAG